LKQYGFLRSTNLAFLFLFPFIMLKQSDNLTTIDTFSYIGGLWVTHIRLWCQSSGVWFLGLETNFMVGFVVRGCWGFYSTTSCVIFCSFISFRIFNILQSLWPVIWLSKYIHSIFTQIEGCILRNFCALYYISGGRSSILHYAAGATIINTNWYHIESCSTFHCLYRNSSLLWRSFFTI